MTGLIQGIPQHFNIGKFEVKSRYLGQVKCFRCGQGRHVERNCVKCLWCGGLLTYDLDFTLNQHNDVNPDDLTQRCHSCDSSWITT